MAFQEYQDPNLGAILKAGYWYQKHTSGLRSVAFGFLLAFNAVFWGFVVYNGALLLGENPIQENMYQDLVVNRFDIKSLHSAQSPKIPLVKEIFAASSITETSDSVAQVKTADFVALVENTNDNWLIKVAYSFVWPAGQTVSASEVLLPGQITPLGIQGVSVNGLPQNVDVRVTVVSWERVKDQSLLEQARAASLGLVIAKSPVEKGANATTAGYSITNTGVYSILDVNLVVLLRRITGEVVGIGYNRLDQIASKESVNLDIRWRRRVSSGLSIEVYPVINFLDRSVYRLPQTGDMQF